MSDNPRQLADYVRHSQVTLCGIHYAPDPTCLACSVCANYPDCARCAAHIDGSLRSEVEFDPEGLDKI